MKKQLLLFATTLISVASFSQVTNGDFENWSVNYLYDIPTPWQTSVSENGGSLSNTTQSSDAQDLLSSVRMETVLDGSDSIFGFVILGNIGDNGPENGTPYMAAGLPDSLIFWAKYDIQPTDSATVVFAMSAMGNPTGMDVFKFVGTQNTWTRKAFKISSTIAVDSIVMAFASSDAFNEYGVPGSWVMIDNIQVKTASAGTWTPPNYSFETWDAINVEDADDWYSLNQDEPMDTTVFKSTDAYANSYAVEIKTVVNDNNDTIEGYLSNGPRVDGSWFTAVPYTAVPASLDFYYKYTPAGVADSGWVQIDLLEGTNSIGGGFQFIKNNGSTYSAMSVTVNQYSAGTVDSMRIMFNSGRNPGSTLLVDVISLNGGTVSTSEIAKQNLVKHFPNPVINELTISYEVLNANANAEIAIYNINGKLIESINLTSTVGLNNQKINTESYAKGMYTYVITLGDNKITNKFIKQ